MRLPFTPSSQSSDMELMNASFDEKTRELTTLALGRGIGDCGIQTRWRFNGQRFRLVCYAEEPSCDNWNGPDAWPTLWDHKVGFCRFCRPGPGAAATGNADRTTARSAPSPPRSQR